jgi:DNA-binding IclR family transcriptional regulator
MPLESSVHYAFVASDRTLDGYAAKTGGSESLFESALGMALLTLFERERIQRLVINSNLRASPARVPVQIGELLTSVTAVNELGYADRPCGRSLPWASVAALLPARLLGIPAAVGTFSRVEQFPLTRQAHLRAVVEMISNV